MPDGVADGIEKGLYLFREAPAGPAAVQLMGSGAILREVIAAADLLASDFGVAANVWSILGVNQLHRDGMQTQEWNRLHPEASPRQSYVEETLRGQDGPVIISTDYVTAYPEQIRRLIPNPVTILGTDGYGRSDEREVLRRHFKVDRHHVAVAALGALASQGDIDTQTVAEAIARYGIDPEAPHAPSS